MSPPLTTLTPTVDVAGRKAWAIRPATTADLDALVRIEERAFALDRFSRRSFRYLLSKANAATLVVDGAGGSVAGYAMVLFHRGMSLARLYSIAVDPEAQGQGIGALLLDAVENVAREHDAAYMRLEVRADADTTQAFYRQRGYRPFGTQPDYYMDGEAAVQMEKMLAPRPDPRLVRVPYYAQTLDFTCGPAAVLMAMHALDPTIAADQTSELRLWRESTTIFMTAGLGGCSPEGLALAAQRRGFDVELFMSNREPMFVDSVRSPTKREVIRLVQEDFRGQLKKSGVHVIFRPLSLDIMRQRSEQGRIPVVLISSYRFDSQKAPHWVVVTGFDHKYVFLHDPNVDEDLDKTVTDCMQIPVLQTDFVKMARYGKAHQQAALVIGRSKT
jgi:ribosomal-protein-alanine acetyltransferase